ncbi:hypothetical protein FRC03_003636 [Tulasnella sp. 419]|nr:hypothetical protein FRC03_003636 [Tulasnella sp. 419]
MEIFKNSHRTHLQPGSEWVKESVLHDANFVLNKETPLASTTLDGVTRLYVYDSDSSLREWIYDGGWYVGSLSHPVNGFGRPLSAISWMEGETPNVSVFYGEAAGGLFEASKSGDGEWSINTIGPARGALSIWARAWFHGNVLQKRLYYQDNAISKQIRESTWNVMQSSPKNAWSPHSETNGFPLKPSKGMSFGGFVLSSGNEHIIVNPPGTTQIVEYLRGGPRPSQFWKEEPTTLAARTRADSPIAVTHCVVDKKDTAFVFYLGLSGELEQISYSNEWSTYSSVVAVFL